MKKKASSMKNSREFVDRLQVVPNTEIRYKVNSCDGSLEFFAKTNGHYEIHIYKVHDEELEELPF